MGRPNTFKEIEKNEIACAFENQENYFVGVGGSDVVGMPVYVIDKATGNVVDTVGDPEFVLDYEVRDELDSKNPNVIRQIDPKTINS